MCAILGILGIRSDAAALRDRALELSRVQRHRGPDWSGIYADSQAILAHERLAIVDVIHGAQPLRTAGDAQVLAVNGEIYNHRDLRRELEARYDFATDSDCEVILPLYLEHGVDFLPRLNGIYAFILWDRERDRFVIARDPVGVVPLYTGRDERGNLYVASEMKALTPVCRSIEVFPPGHVWDSTGEGRPVPFYDPTWRSYDRVIEDIGRTVEAEGPSEGQSEVEATEIIRGALMEAVHRQLMSDVPYGVLLSGGLDSTAVAAIAHQYAARRVEEDDAAEAWWPRLHSFAIGLDDSPDLDAARGAAEYIGTVHHEFHFTMQEGFDALREVIRHLETYDVTTIRASTPMYLMARRIRATGIKMVLSGEGADEIFGGYLYFHKAPNAREFHEETVRKIARLHSYDCLRANKSMAAWGVEARVPFLDLDFLDAAMRIDPTLKMVSPNGIEKRILRNAFEDILPAEVFRRQKEQFSDGVGYGWIDGLRNYAEERVSETDLDTAPYRFSHNTPDTKEGYLYRMIFEEHFPLPSAAQTVPGGKSVACSTPEALAWDPSFTDAADPSGRAVRGVHNDAY